MNIFDNLVVSALSFIPKPIVWQFSKPYVAGSNISDAVRIIKKLNGEGVSTTVDVLGEFITNTNQVSPTVDMYKRVLDVIDQEKLDANISIKLTAFGLQLDKKFCIDSALNLIGYANDKYNNFVRIDMEDSNCTTDTIEVYQRAHKQYEKVGLVVQSYLHRCMDDVQRLIKEEKVNLRICKGIYIEPPDIAFQTKMDIRQNFVALVDEMLKNDCYVAIATHDQYVVEETMRLIERYKIRPDQYEYQMLLGVLPNLRRKIVKQGHRMRVYVPFGKDWYGYCTRRLKENPTIARHVLKNLIKAKK